MWESSTSQRRLLIPNNDQDCSSVPIADKSSHVRDEGNTSQDSKEETVYGNEDRESDRTDQNEKILRLMRFYLFVVCLVSTHLLCKKVNESLGLHGLHSITDVGLCRFIPFFLCFVYCGIFCSHSAMIKKQNIVFRYIGQTASANGSTLPSLPQDCSSFLSITMSYLKTKLYLFVLGLALMGIDIILAKHGVPHHLYTLLCPTLYFLGFFLQTYLIFDYRTNVVLLLGFFQAGILAHSPGLGYWSWYLFLAIYRIIFPNPKPAGEVAAVTSAVPVVAGAPTASVETGTEQNRETRENLNLTGTDSAANQQDGVLVAVAAPVDRQSTWTQQAVTGCFFSIFAIFVVSITIAAVNVISLLNFQPRGSNIDIGMIFTCSIASVSVAYACIFESYSTSYTGDAVAGFKDDDDRIHGTGGSVLLQPRVTHSNFIITISFLKIFAYLSLLCLGVACGDTLLIRVGLPFAFIPYVTVALYCGGFFFYTYHAFTYRTNILLAVAMVFTILDMVSPDICFTYLVYVVEAHSYIFLRHGGEGEGEGTAEDTPHSTGDNSVVTTVTGTESDLEMQDSSRAEGGSREANAVK